jgi:hypothetical protein
VTVNTTRRFAWLLKAHNDLSWHTELHCHPVGHAVVEKATEIEQRRNGEKAGSDPGDQTRCLILRQEYGCPRDRSVEAHKRNSGSPQLLLVLGKPNISKADRERLKQASKALLASLRAVLKTMQDWTKNVATQAEVKVSILDDLYQLLPRPPYTDQETDEVAEHIYEYVRERSASGDGLMA